MQFVPAYTKAFPLLLAALLLTACTAEREPASDTATDNERPAVGSATPAATPLQSPATPGLSEFADTIPADAASTAAAAVATVTPAADDQVTTTTTPEADITTETAAADDTKTTPPRPADVGYEGLVQSIGNIERSLTPYFTDDMARISPEAAERLGRQTSKYVSEIKNAASVDKAVRTDLREYAIEVHLAIQQMARTSNQEQYRALRSAAQQRVEQIQAELMGARNKPLPQ